MGDGGAEARPEAERQQVARGVGLDGGEVIGEGHGVRWPPCRPVSRIGVASVRRLRYNAVSAAARRSFRGFA